MNYNTLINSSKLFTDIPKEIKEFNKKNPIIINYNIDNILNFKFKNSNKKQIIDGKECYLDQLNLSQIAKFVNKNELERQNINEKIVKDITVILNKTVIEKVQQTTEALLLLYKKYYTQQTEVINDLILSTLLTKILTETQFKELYKTLLLLLLKSVNTDFIFKMNKYLENLLFLILNEKIPNDETSDYEIIIKNKFKNFAFIVGVLAEKYIAVNILENYYKIIFNAEVLQNNLDNKLEYICILLNSINQNINKNINMFKSLINFLKNSKTKSFRIKCIVEAVVKLYN